MKFIGIIIIVISLVIGTSACSGATTIINNTTVLPTPTIISTFTTTNSGLSGNNSIDTANAELGSVRTAISAYEAEHGAALPTARNGAGMVINSLIAPYLSRTIQGTYQIDSNGYILSTSTYPGRVWDMSTMKWK